LLTVRLDSQAVFAALQLRLDFTNVAFRQMRQWSATAFVTIARASSFFVALVRRVLML